MQVGRQIGWKVKLVRLQRKTNKRGSRRGAKEKPMGHCRRQTDRRTADCGTLRGELQMRAITGAGGAWVGGSLGDARACMGGSGYTEY
jgi:hypothetical protein